MLALALGGRIPDPDSYEEISRRLRHPADPGPAWARDLAKRIMSRAEKEGAPHCHWAEELVAAVLMYMGMEIPEENRFAATLLDFLLDAEVSERNEALKSGLDIKFEELGRKDRNHPAVLAYRSWKQLPGKELRQSMGHATDAVLRFREWEVENCEEVIRMLEAEEEKSRKIQEEIRREKEEKEKLHMLWENLGVLWVCSACGKEIEPVKDESGNWVKDERLYCLHCGMIADPAERGRIARGVMEETGEYLPGLEPS